MIAIVQADAIKSYYVATDDVALKVRFPLFSIIHILNFQVPCNSSCAQALQALYEVVWTFNLEYDKDVSLLFEFLENLTEFYPTKPKSAQPVFTKLKEALRLAGDEEANEQQPSHNSLAAASGNGSPGAFTFLCFI